MKKYTQKGIREFARLGLATDITNYSVEQCVELKKKTNLSQEGYSAGIYGINGALLKDLNTGDMYVIGARNTALSYFC